MRLTKILGALALAVICSLTLSSCGGYSSKAAEKMTEKYSDGDMKKDDFSKCIDWVEEAFKEQEEYLEKAITDSKNEKKFEKNAEDAEEKWEEKWEDIDDIVDMLDKAADDEDKDMGSSNIKRWEKVQEKHLEKLNKLMEKYNKKFDD